MLVGIEPTICSGHLPYPWEWHWREGREGRGESKCFVFTSWLMATFDLPDIKVQCPFLNNLRVVTLSSVLVAPFFDSNLTILSWNSHLSLFFFSIFQRLIQINSTVE